MIPGYFFCLSTTETINNNEKGASVQICSFFNRSFRNHIPRKHKVRNVHKHQIYKIESAVKRDAPFIFWIYFKTRILKCGSEIKIDYKGKYRLTLTKFWVWIFIYFIFLTDQPLVFFFKPRLSSWVSSGDISSILLYCFSELIKRFWSSVNSLSILSQLT